MNAAQWALTIGLLFYACHVVVGSEQSDAPRDSRFATSAEAEVVIGPVDSVREWLGRAVLSQDAEAVGRIEDLALDL